MIMYEHPNAGGIHYMMTGSGKAPYAFQTIMSEVYITGELFSQVDRY